MSGSNPVSVIDVCSGYSAFTQGTEGLGFETVAYAEIEPFPAAVLGHRYGASRPRYMPNPEAEGISAKEAKHRAALAKSMAALNDSHFGNAVTNFGDFTQIRSDDVGPVRLLVGGTPCQAFSIAGKRLGLDDPRGNLTLEYLALAKRVRASWLAWENVPGFLSHDGGRTMGTFLGLLGELGYGWAYRVLDAQYIRVDGCPRAVPQRRKRLIVVGYSREMGRPEDAGALLDRGGISSLPAAVLFDRESLRGDLAPRRRTGEGTSADVAPSLVRSGRGSERTGDTRGQDPVVAVQTFGGGNCAGPIDIATAQTAHGNRLDFDSETFVAHSLRAEGFDGSGRGTPIIPISSPHCFDARQSDVVQYGPLAGPLDTDGHSQAIAFSSKDHGADAGELCPTLRSMGHADSHANGGGQVTVAFSVRGRDGEPQAEVAEDGLAPALRAVNGGSSHAYIAQSWAVRRLTPVECARLMDVPDEFLRIPFRGKPASDGPIYKALGNSQARNMMRWLAIGLRDVMDIEDGLASPPPKGIE